jgi:hypothetical protein
LEKGVGQGCGLAIRAVIAILALLFLYCGGPGLFLHEPQNAPEQKSGANALRP